MDTNEYEDFLSNLKSYQGNPKCFLLQSLEILHGKWTAKIIFHLLKSESMRFGDLKKAIPAITNTMLTTTLRALEQQEILNRRQYNEIPPHVEYFLTEKGSALLPIFYELWHWGKIYPIENGISE
ncbi:winged helix-turn-helix transcriptional regulator [Ethanoligenens harbinense]|uniref:Transcriptional regulator, HxlR family n=1 Tax=Ethanoligenens harbinense (strain DSM 18485 / JCM 12961 / CGMCC 1.5033 / YUAN-3) TaxID=663278 RepID=E6U3T4_ETHHY|nr:helix-turn-helix domain-containing protein [Ethanoligenens harbinense]ADU26501.1 transcriptional regulator, HxlR family [Ethanoligenens harbinense YUAN-3]AVQ95626.1 transcriptional regulator [Ethanoligenens harbinense YUAN-3]AYF38290.1 transcriptional regulator [Ethanoligenens harbinense]AYF41036.1 transcriptional regulator [Ethanoligenens harbinense]QCN91867.1 transcriptional regulator [Ethanoligenens harbinense]